MLLIQKSKYFTGPTKMPTFHLSMLEGVEMSTASQKLNKPDTIDKE